MKILYYDYIRISTPPYPPIVSAHLDLLSNPISKPTIIILWSTYLYNTIRTASGSCRTSTRFSVWQIIKERDDSIHLEKKMQRPYYYYYGLNLMNFYDYPSYTTSLLLLLSYYNIITLFEHDFSNYYYWLHSYF